MTTDARPSPHDADPRAASPLLQALIEALNHDGPGPTLSDLLSDGSGPGLIRTLLAQSRLSPEQQSVVDLLGALEGNGHAAPARAGGGHGRCDDDDIVDVEPVAEHAAAGPGASNPPAARQADWRELRDLRQLNDTLAAALGACRVCWGGDAGCDVCGGRGRAGFARPDLDLFDELVAPALRRVVTMRRAGRSDPYRNRR